MESMQALVKSSDGLRIERRSPPRLEGRDDVLLRVICAGLCRTDMHVAEGRLPVSFPRTLGHELSAIVAQAPVSSGLAIGAPVTLQPAIPCGACRLCRDEGPAIDPPRCMRPQFLGVDRDGAFAEWLAVPSCAVFPLPFAIESSFREVDLTSSMSLSTRIDWQRGAYVEPVAAALAVLRAPLGRTDRGLIYGDNRIAELTRRILVAHGFERVVLASESTSLEESSFDFAIETVATTAAMRALLDAVRPGGVIVLKSRPLEAISLDVARAVAKEISFHAVRYGSFREAVALLWSGNLAVDDLFESAVSLADFEAAFARARASESKKVFFLPGMRGSPNGER